MVSLFWCVVSFVPRGVGSRRGWVVRGVEWSRAPILATCRDTRDPTRERRDWSHSSPQAKKSRNQRSSFVWPFDLLIYPFAGHVSGASFPFSISCVLAHAQIHPVINELCLVFCWSPQWPFCLSFSCVLARGRVRPSSLSSSSRSASSGMRLSTHLPFID